MNILLTGASGGIGRAVIKKFVSKGCSIWACAGRYNEEFEDFLQKEWTAGGQNGFLRPVYFNLSDETEIRRALGQVVKEKKPVDVLINNAGMPFCGNVQTTSLDKLREVMEVNFIAQMAVTQMISRSMIRQKHGVIINVGSVGGIEAREGYLAYGASKAALMWASRSIAKELAHYQIRVNAVAPGLIDTAMGMYKPQRERDRMIEANSIRRMGKPEEVAELIWFLASDQSSYVTGSVWNIDGGRMI